MNPSSHTSPLRLVARIGNGHGWTPDGITEVVAHTDGHFLTVAVTRLTGARGAVEVHEFECGDHEPCLRAVRTWLHSLALPGGEHSAEHVEDWAERTARRLVEPLRQATPS